MEFVNAALSDALEPPDGTKLFGCGDLSLIVILVAPMCGAVVEMIWVLAVEAEAEVSALIAFPGSCKLQELSASSPFYSLQSSSVFSANLRSYIQGLPCGSVRGNGDVGRGGGGGDFGGGGGGGGGRFWGGGGFSPPGFC